LIVQDEFAASVLAHVPVPVFTKSPALPPVFVIVIEVTEEAVAFVRVNVTGAPQNPTAIVPKFRLEGLSVTEPATPVPVSVACCGLVAPLSATLRVADREPVAPGVNVTMIVQEDEAARELPHVPPVLEKSPPFVPINVTTMLVTDTAVVFESVNVAQVVGIPTITEPQPWLVGETVTDPVAFPVPLSAEVCGLAPSPPLYETLRVVDREPVAPGVKVTVKVQAAFAARVPLAAPQDPVPVLLIVKSLGFPPVVVGLMLVAVVLEPFVSVNVTGELDDPRLTEPKLSVAGESVTPLISNGCGSV
jgi:hypothetical protein